MKIDYVQNKDLQTETKTFVIHRNFLVKKASNRIHKIALRHVCNDRNDTFKEIITNEKSVTLHDRSLKVLLTKMFKVKRGISTITIDDAF